jgi:hypothetical protein
MLLRMEKMLGISSHILMYSYLTLISLFIYNFDSELFRFFGIKKRLNYILRLLLRFHIINDRPNAIFLLIKTTRIFFSFPKVDIFLGYYLISSLIFKRLFSLKKMKKTTLFDIKKFDILLSAMRSNMKMKENMILRS